MQRQTKIPAHTPDNLRNNEETETWKRRPQKISEELYGCITFCSSLQAALLLCMLAFFWLMKIFLVLSWSDSSLFENILILFEPGRTETLFLYQFSAGTFKITCLVMLGSIVLGLATTGSRTSKKMCIVWCSWNRNDYLGWQIVNWDLKSRAQSKCITQPEKQKYKKELVVKQMKVAHSCQSYPKIMFPEFRGEVSTDRQTDRQTHVRTDKTKTKTAQNDNLYRSSRCRSKAKKRAVESVLLQVIDAENNSLINNGSEDLDLRMLYGPVIRVYTIRHVIYTQRKA